MNLDRKIAFLESSIRSLNTIRTKRISMTREEAYCQGMAEGGYSSLHINLMVQRIKGYATERNQEPFSGPDWKGLDDYIKRKTQNNERSTA